MKKFKILSVIVSILIISTSALLVASEILEPQFNGAQKIGNNIKRMWQNAMEIGALETEVRCMVKLEGVADKSSLKRLNRAGFEEKSVLKTVVTGQIALGNLPFLVSIGDVTSVEGGNKLGFK